MMVCCRFIIKRTVGKGPGRAGSSRSGGGQQGSLMDEEWRMSSRSEYAPSETGSSTEDTVSMMDKSCEAVGGSSSEVMIRKRDTLIVLRVAGRGTVGGNPQWRVGSGGGRQLEMGSCLITREGV